MRATILTFALLAATPLGAQTVKTILSNGPVANRYDIVILGDGYQAHEEARFDQDAKNAIDRLFTKPAYGTYKQFFNAHTVFRASNESGADHPDAQPPIYKDTVYDATYNYGGTGRCLYIQNTSQANADARLAPDVEGRIMVVVNDSRYGGCGGTFAVSYNGSSGPEVQAHEFGHSFGGLADEYDYGRSGTYTGPEPSQPNITADSTGMTKWPLWLGHPGIGVFQGAGYYQTGLWRPKSNCLMRALNIALCEICDEQLVKRCYQEVDPIENRSPAAQTITVGRLNPTTFSITSLVPGQSSIVWEVDGQQVATGPLSFSWNTSTTPSGRHTVSVTVKDLTTFVRKDPSELLTSSESWAVDVLSTKPGAYTTFGSGCPGSRTLPQICQSMNTGGVNQGLATRDNVTYAIRVTAAQSLAVTGFELQTSSRQTGSVTVPIELYSANRAGQPEFAVRRGTMVIGPGLGWYQGTLPLPYTVPAGTDFFIAFASPTPGIAASIVSGTSTPYFRNDGPNGSWTGPFTSNAWAYRIRCVSGTAVPTLAATGVPEVGTTFQVNLELAIPNTPVGLVIGVSNTHWGASVLPFGLAGLGAPGCSLLVSFDHAVGTQTDATGAASVLLTVPGDPSLVDKMFYNQFYVIDPQANLLGIAWTNGGTGKIGKP